MKAKRYNKGKSRVDLISTTAIIALGHALDFGARKYGEHNYKKGQEWSKPLASLLRHTFKFMDGEDLDFDPKCKKCIKKCCKEHSGLPHCDLAMSNCMMLCDYFRNHKKYDDRYRPKKKRRKK